MEKKDEKLYGLFTGQSKGTFAMENEERVPIHLKMTLTIKEAAEYRQKEL